MNMQNRWGFRAPARMTRITRESEPFFWGMLHAGARDIRHVASGTQQALDPPHSTQPRNSTMSVHHAPMRAFGGHVLPARHAVPARIRGTVHMSQSAMCMFRPPLQPVQEKVRGEPLGAERLPQQAAKNSPQSCTVALVGVCFLLSAAAAPLPAPSPTRHTACRCWQLQVRPSPGSHV